MAKLKKLQHSLTAEKSQSPGLLAAAVKRTFTAVAALLKGSASLLYKIGVQLGSGWEKATRLMEDATLNLYREIHWELSLKLSSKSLSCYVILSKAFCDSCVVRGKNIPELADYLDKAKEYYDVIGTHLLKPELLRAQAFFEDAKALWESKTSPIESAEDEYRELTTCMKRVVALQLGKLHKSIGLTFYKAYTKLAQRNVEVKLKDYVKCCLEALNLKSCDQYAVKKSALEYYTYNRWDLKAIDARYLEAYKADKSLFGSIKRLCSYSINVLLSPCKKLHSCLMPKDKHNTESFIKSLIEGSTPKKSSRHSIVKSKSYTNCALSSTKTNGLRFFSLGETIMKSIRNEMFVAYSRGSKEVTVVMKSVAGTGEVKKKLQGKLEGAKCIVQGSNVTLKIDARKWMSASDLWKSITNLYYSLRKCGGMKNAELLYTAAIKKINSMKKTCTTG